MLVVLDTNMLLVPFRFRVDVYSELRRLAEGARVEFVTLRSCVRELEGISRAAGVRADGRNARSALSSLGKIPVRVEDAFDDRPADDGLAAFARERGAVLASTDKDLRDRVKAAGGKAVALRSKKHLVFA